MTNPIQISANDISQIAQKIDLLNYDFFSSQNSVQLDDSSQNGEGYLGKIVQRLARLLAVALGGQFNNDQNNFFTQPQMQTIANLYNAGLHSAYQASLSGSATQFVSTYGSCFITLNAGVATNFYNAAVGTTSKVVMDYVAISQHNDPSYVLSRFNNLSAGTAANFDNLPSYAELFGNTDFCKCPDCRSIFSPAAYTVDLMRVVENYISGAGANYTLAARRPDLQNLKLDHNKTNNLVSKVEIVNEVLMQQIGKNWQAISTVIYPFNAPYNHELNRINNYLAQNNLSLAQLANQLECNVSATQQQNISLLKLGISQEQWNIISVSNSPNEAQFYGLTSSTSLVNVADFLAASGLNYKQLNELLFEDLGVNEVAPNTDLRANFYINSSATNSPLETSSDGTTFVNSTDETFDLIQRFVRLSNILKWSFSDLDLVLATIAQINTTTIAIDDAILPYLVWIKDLHDNKNLSLKQICGFLYQIKNYGEKNTQTFFDEIFNNKNIPNNPFIATTSPITLIGATWNFPANTNYSSTDKQIQNALAIALNLSHSNLLNAAQIIAGANVTSLTITLDNLSLLYGLGLLPQIVGLNWSECETLYTLTITSSTGLMHDFVTAKPQQIFTIADNLIESAKWLRAKNLSVYRLQYWLTQNSNDPKIQGRIIDEKVLQNFITDLQKVIQHSLVNNPLIGTTPTYTATQLDSNGVVLSAGTDANLLHAQQAQQKIFDNKLATLLDVDAKTIYTLCSFAQLSLDEILNADPNNLILPKLQIMQTCANWIKTIKFSAIELRALQNSPQCFGVTSVSPLKVSLENLKTFYQFAEIRAAFSDEYNRILAYMLGSAADTAIAQTSANALATLVKCDPTQLLTLMQKLWPTVNSPAQWGTVSGIHLLYRYFEFSKTIGRDVNVMIDITTLLAESTFAYADLQTIADQLWSGLLLNYKNDDKTLSKIKNTLLNNQRDVLLPMVMSNLAAKNIPINGAQDLYEYLLIDVKVDAVVETSYVVEANSALQLYIYRCLNYLENGVVVDKELKKIWSWMENYRVWQANREVFLYPENYIEPDLLKNKTNLYSTLQSALQQGDLSDKNTVENAVKNYLDGLTKVANLSISGAAGYDYSDDESAQNNLKNICLIGASNSQPTNYYYLNSSFALDQNGNYNVANWGQWLEINCHMQPISSVTPIFALGRWFIFWVEESKTGSDHNNPSNLEYTYSVYYSNLDHAKNWSTKQLVAQQVSAATPLTTLPVINPYYINSIETLFIPFNSTLYSVGQHDISSIVVCDRYVSNTVPAVNPALSAMTNQIAGANNTIPQYYENFSALNGNQNLKNLSNGGLGYCLASWVSISSLPASGATTNLINYPGSTNHNITYPNIFDLSIDPNGNILFSSILQSQGILADSVQAQTITAGTWNHFAISNVEDQSYVIAEGLAGSISQISNVITYQEENYIAWAQKSVNNVNNMNLYLASLVEGADGQLVLDNIKEYPYQITFQIEQIFIESFDGEIYINCNDGNGNYVVSAFDGSGKAIVRQQFDDSMTNFVTNVNIHPTGQMVVYNNGLWMSYRDAATCNYAFIQIADSSGVGDFSGSEMVFSQPSFHAVAASVQMFNGNLYFAWIDNNSQVQVGILDNNQISSVQIFSWPAVIPQNNELNNFSLFVGGNNLNIAAVSRWSALSVTCIADENGFVSATDFANNATQMNNQNDSYSINFSIFNGAAISCDGTAIYYNFQGLKLYLNGNLYMRAPCGIPLGSSNFVIGDNNVCMQEFLSFYNNSAPSTVLSDSQIFDLYHNSKKFITRNFENVAATSAAFSGTVVTTNILSQPNWNILNSGNISLLTLPQNGATNLRVIRLNSTALPKLNSAFFVKSVDGLFTVEAQLIKESDINSLNPQPSCILNLPASTLDFISGPMSNYYWELFFYVPFLIASQLQNQQQFQAAKKWFEYIFNPSIEAQKADLGGDANENDKYWRFVGLRSVNNPTLAQELSQSVGREFMSDSTNSAQLYAYHNDPFDPHAIARLRPIAYQKSIVMDYVDNLISWGDNLYRQYTKETIGEAEMLYTIAFDLLGKKPRDLGECAMEQTQTLGQIMAHYGNTIPEFILQLEQNPSPISYALNVPANYIPNAYFGLPQNEQFSGYLDQIIQRLYNIRHSLTINGIFDQVALFAPAINPMELVEAIGEGESVQEVINNLSATIPFYRFKVMISKAKEITNVVTQFGQSLLSALEKKDAQQLSRLYNVNSQNILSLTQTIKQNELNSAQQSLQTLQANLQTAQDRLSYYSSLINSGFIAAEDAQLTLDAASIILQTAAQPAKAPALFAYLMPTIFGFADGGFKPGDSMAMIPSIIEGSAQSVSMSANLAQSISSYQRRAQEWQQQQTLANDEIAQIQSQILGAQYQQIIAQQEINILQKNIAQEQKVYQLLLTKFTNQELYQWLVGQLAALYFQSYQMAYKMAQQCELAWQFEKGLPTSLSIIQSGYWNNLYHGLSSGEALLLDLYRLEQSYMEKNTRELEIQKTISLVELASYANDPANPAVANPNAGIFAALTTVATPTCNIVLNQGLFDLDYPTHYRRQIKSVSLSFPALLAPYQNVCATLVQTSSYIQLTSGSGPTAIAAPSQQIALSQGVNDFGLISPNPEDERYLPFEGTGAISNWTLTMEKGSLGFLSSLSDVIIQINYTALSS